MEEGNKRRFQRYEVEGMEGSFVFSLDVRVLNLSVAGMAVETSGRLNVGRRYEFKLHDGVHEITVPGRVAWCVLGRTRRSPHGDVTPVYKAGVQFDEILTDKAENLVRLIEDNAAVRLEKRVFGRFQVGEGGAAKLASEADFVVRKISLAGMLVESDFVLERDSLLTLEVRLSDETITASGRVAYVEPAGSREGHDVVQLGLEFVELGPDARSALERFIACEAGGEVADAAPEADAEG